MEGPSRSKIFRETIIKKRSEQRDGAFVQSICTKTPSPCSPRSKKGKPVIGDKPYKNMREENENDEISR